MPPDLRRGLLSPQHLQLYKNQDLTPPALKAESAGEEVGAVFSVGSAEGLLRRRVSTLVGRFRILDP